MYYHELLFALLLLSTIVTQGSHVKRPKNAIVFLGS
jgi:hypothetical protein